MIKPEPYEANAHSAQMAILRSLLMSQDSSFSELTRRTDLTSDHANFHIKKLLITGMVERVPKQYGKYRLTRKGKEYANRMDTEELVIEKQPKLVVDIAIERPDGKFLFQERRKQPYFGYWSFPTGKIRWGETIVQAAQRELLEETNLTADMSYRGTYHKLDYDSDGALLEDKYLILVYGTNPSGDMVKETESHTNHWLTPDEFNALEKRFGGLDETLAHIRNNDMFISETKYTYRTESY